MGICGEKEYPIFPNDERKQTLWIGLTVGNKGKKQPKNIFVGMTQEYEKLK